MTTAHAPVVAIAVELVSERNEVTIEYTSEPISLQRFSESFGIVRRDDDYPIVMDDKRNARLPRGLL